MTLSISTLLTRKGVSCRNQGVSWTKIAFLFKCSYFCCLLLHVVQKAELLCTSNVKAIIRCLFLYGGGGACAEAKIFSVKKKLQKALPSVQFLSSFINFYFEILSYPARG